MLANRRRMDEIWAGVLEFACNQRQDSVVQAIRQVRKVDASHIPIRLRLHRIHCKVMSVQTSGDCADNFDSIRRELEELKQDRSIDDETWTTAETDAIFQWCVLYEDLRTQSILCSLRMEPASTDEFEQSLDKYYRKGVPMHTDALAKEVDKSMGISEDRKTRLRRALQFGSQASRRTPKAKTMHVLNVMRGSFPNFLKLETFQSYFCTNLKRLEKALCPKLWLAGVYEEAKSAGNVTAAEEVSDRMRSGGHGLLASSRRAEGGDGPQHQQNRNSAAAGHSHGHSHSHSHSNRFGTSEITSLRQATLEARHGAAMPALSESEALVRSAAPPDDDDTEEDESTAAATIASRARARRAAAKAASGRTSYKVGDQVMARWLYPDEQAKYPGEYGAVVSGDHGDGTYAVKFDDGNYFAKQPADKMRPKRIMQAAAPRPCRGRGRGYGHMVAGARGGIVSSPSSAHAAAGDNGSGAILAVPVRSESAHGDLLACGRNPLEHNALQVRRQLKSARRDLGRHSDPLPQAVAAAAAAAARDPQSSSSSSTVSCGRDGAHGARGPDGQDRRRNRRSRKEGVQVAWDSSQDALALDPIEGGSSAEEEQNAHKRKRTPPRRGPLPDQRSVQVQSRLLMRRSNNNVTVAKGVVDRRNKEMMRRGQKKKGRRRHAWSQEEVEYLKLGVSKHGFNWKLIRDEYSFNERTNVNLKDKWRNLIKKDPALSDLVFCDVPSPKRSSQRSRRAIASPARFGQEPDTKRRKASNDDGDGDAAAATDDSDAR